MVEGGPSKGLINGKGNRIKTSWKKSLQGNLKMCVGTEVENNAANGIISMVLQEILHGVYSRQ